MMSSPCLLRTPAIITHTICVTGRRMAGALLLCGTLLFLTGCSGPDSTPSNGHPELLLRPGETIDLMARLEGTGRKTGGDPGQIESLPHFHIKHLTRSALPLALPLDLTTPSVRLPAGESVLTVTVAVNKIFWGRHPSPVTLRTMIHREGGEWEEIHLVSLEPATRHEERGWVDLRVPITPYAGERIQFRFAAETASVRSLPGGKTGEHPLLLAELALVSESEPDDRDPPLRKNVIILLVDTLRADHLGCYGHDRGTSPQMDRLSSHGVLFSRALSQSPWTLPSVATLFTGTYPSRHGVNRDTALTLKNARLTLAEVVRGAGYRTVAVTANKLVGTRTGMAQGFQILDQVAASEPRLTRADVVNRQALSWLQRIHRQPFFLYIHYLDPHGPYWPPEPFRLRFVPGPPEGILSETARGYVHWAQQQVEKTGRSPLSPAGLEYLRTLYESEIVFVDHAIGQLLAEVERMGIGDRTVVYLTSDHGEEFLDHGGFKHSTTLYQELLHVPLIIRDPDHGRGRRVDEAVMLADLPSTVLASLGIEPPPEFAGPDLLDPADLSRRLLFAEMMPSPDHDPRLALGQGKRSVQYGKHKLIRNLSLDTDAIYDLVADPGERRNLLAAGPLEDGPGEERGSIGIDPGEAETLTTALESFLAGGAIPAQREEITDEQREMLQALGYLQ